MKKIENDVWFYEIAGELKTIDGRDSLLSNTDIERLRTTVNFLIRDIRLMSSERLYTGVIRGGRVARLKRVIKNIHYWLERESTLTSAFKQGGVVDVHLYRTDKDVYGNEFRHYYIDLNGFNPVPGIFISGRMLLYVEPVLESELIASKIKRFFEKWIPWSVNKNNDKFQTVFDVRGKFWVNDRCYFDVGIYRTYVNGMVSRAYTDPHHDTREEHEQRKFRFYSRRSVSQC